jgi:hypothetical protein
MLLSCCLLWSASPTQRRLDLYADRADCLAVIALGDLSPSIMTAVSREADEFFFVLKTYGFAQ